MAISGSEPKEPSESCFVADEDFGRLDTPQPITASDQVVTVSIKTTRYVGSVDADGFLLLADAAIERGTLAETLLLTIRAQITAVDAGGTLGRDGVDVEVFLHKGTKRETSLGKLEGSFGSGWEDFKLDVDVRHVRFPDDPCLERGSPCGQEPEPRPNEISLKFTGSINPGMGMKLEVDWLTLEPKDQPGLAWRPVLLDHGWDSNAAEVTADGVPVTDATVKARVAHPDGTTTTAVDLSEGTGSGEYSGVFAATTLSGLYDVVVSAEGTAPGFTREQLFEVSVAPSATAFSGMVSDRGVDADGDGRYDQLVVDVGIEVDVAAAYRVFGTLTDDAGTTIEQVRVELQLPAGPQTVSLPFDGALLFALGRDGPYLLDDLVIEDVATLTSLARGPEYTTAAYAHTDFRRPPLLLTGTASDHGAHTEHMERLPYEALVVEVEVDTLVGVDVEAAAKLYAEDDTFVAVGRTFSSLAPGLGVLEFRFPPSQIFRAGRPGPFTLQLLSMWGTSADGTPVSLRAPASPSAAR